LADGRAANPFESVLRAIALEVPGLVVRPQVWIDPIGRPDLVDEASGLVLEADSFEFHGRRRRLKSDAERYNAIVVAGWRVLRFSWEHVMFEPVYVRQVLCSPPCRRWDGHMRTLPDAAAPARPVAPSCARPTGVRCR
jgi:very-short-patch-repair endonuclease